MSDTLEQRAYMYGPILVRAFVRYGLPGVWGMAIARQESAFLPTAKNIVGGDAERGGAFGLCQVTLHTARQYDLVVSPDELLVPGTNADIAAQICRDNNKRFPGSLPDVAALYNGGKPFASPHLSPDTRDKYVPAVLRYADAYRDMANRIEQQIAKEPKGSS